MDWIITETNRLSPADIDRQGNKFLIGNGFIGYRGTLEEHRREQKPATIVSGLYDQVGAAWREPINLPNGGLLQVIVQGETLSADASRVVDHWQGIHMREAVHERQTTFETAAGMRIQVCSRRFVSLARKELLCVEYTLQVDQSNEVDLRTGIDADVWDINGPHLEQIVSCQLGEIFSVTAVTHEKGIPIAVSEWTGGWEAGPDNGSLQSRDEPVGLRLIRNIPVEGSLTIHKYVAHVTGLESASPLEESRRQCEAAVRLGFEALLKEHSVLWHKRWNAGDIRIEGDPAAQQALRFSLYHLLSIVPTHTERASIPARGMSGQMYKGAVFWDTEIFMLPFFIHTFPEIARRLLMYRYHTLEGARRKAREYGYRGAFYAWESQDTGEEACSLFNVTDVFTNRPLRTYFRDKQIHISADIPYALWRYYTITGDRSIWLDGGAEVVFECARFFLSYLHYSPDKKRYELLDVTGADEYHERVHNNAFTNRMVGHTFEICRQVARTLLKAEPGFFAGLMERLGFEADLAAIDCIAPDLFQPDSVADGERIAQFDGYFSLEDVPLQDLLDRRLDPNEYLGGGSGLASTTQIIKQADVILMMYLFENRYSPLTKAANWEYYEPRTEHGSSLSACSYSIIAAQLGKVDPAYRYFMKSATLDLEGEGKQYAGGLYIGGTHPAGSGGAWMALVFGLCGIRPLENGLEIRSNLPTQWKKVVLPFLYHGHLLKISLTHETIAIQVLDSLGQYISIQVKGNAYTLPLEGELVLPADESLPASRTEDSLNETVP
jgi:trehalose/maltose hydrolase-like predicted phosphorylase